MEKMSVILEGLRKRSLLLYQFLFNADARQRTRLHEMMFHLFSPSMYKAAMQQSTMVEEDDVYRYYEIKGYKDVFIYPKAAPDYSLAMILSESRPQHWHYYEIPETAVAPGDVVVDCGSAEGFFAFKYQHVASRIFALEPLPMFVASLKALFRSSPSVEVLPVAAGDNCCKAFMQAPSGPTALDATVCIQPQDGNAVEVEVVTIDSLFADKGIHIDYLKADIEGFEEPMIKGALRTIRDSKPKIAVTTYHKGQDYKKLISLVKAVVPEYKYRVKGIDFASGNPVMLHMWI
ncbi:FkbM family methyltransferase [Chitinophaga vietnamensis]|uniref:FkbM family methyltransferase n=1 Tax=Chitinophaga vietnamensis TaxID=2593957 RepID=UPI001375EA0F|nr:FkbM family methyltransferase [Chitinophaga vietnamensis]